jgi:hypothetical protein
MNLLPLGPAASAVMLYLKTTTTSCLHNCRMQALIHPPPHTLCTILSKKEVCACPYLQYATIVANSLRHVKCSSSAFDAFCLN